MVGHNLGPGKLLEPAGQTVVVGMDMGDDNLGNVLKFNAGLCQLLLQRVESLGSIPAGIDQQALAISPNEIGVDMTEELVGEWQWQMVNPWYDLFHPASFLDVFEGGYACESGILP